MSRRVGVRPMMALAAACLAAVTACAPAARTELPREARGATVHAERQKASALTDDYLRRINNSGPVQGTLDGCEDLRPQHVGFSWRCSITRAGTITDTSVDTALTGLHERLRTEKCSAAPGLQATLRRHKEGLAPAYLYDVDYLCPNGIVVVIRFSEPTDKTLPQKLDLRETRYSPGGANVISEQPFAAETVDALQADESKKVIMLIAVQKQYWQMPVD
ncbi:hypothetical protein ACQBAR_08435 [Propionibacteriaceae bacterium Y1685]|uniref:hypothetical protein n=1 Tax=Microlunatus sp. Y1700 TaxID=3418487 RepID=UPI003B7FCF01